MCFFFFFSRFEIFLKLFSFSSSHRTCLERELYEFPLCRDPSVHCHWACSIIACSDSQAENDFSAIEQYSCAQALGKPECIEQGAAGCSYRWIPTTAAMLMSGFKQKKIEFFFSTFTIFL